MHRMEKIPQKINEKLAYWLKTNKVTLRVTNNLTLEFFLNVFNKCSKSGDKIFVIKVKCSNLPLLVQETRMLPQCQQDICEKQDL